MGLLRAIVDAWCGPSAEREQARRLREAKLLLVDHACQLEYYTHSVLMLRARIARIESQSAQSVSASGADIRMCTQHQADLALHVHHGPQHDGATIPWN
ncbi:hypothetical protein [Paraburkholderia sp. MM6662-R1]|uniref:hypothetical protein n=1 Tax=Paraburkholderia sp. MM6662-R1 TaxID=2991066 RepID=UPI003D1F47EC